MVSPDSQATACLPSGRNSTYRLVQISATGSEVRVFGSYLEDVHDLGDIDLAVELRPRQVDGADWIDLCLARAEQSGRRFSNYLQRLHYSQKEVLMILKAKSPYISIHDLKQLGIIKARAQVIFKV
jgi:hypothetical protein